MKTVITILVIVFAGIMACDTPGTTTTNPGDTTGINSNRPDTTMNTGTDTSANTGTDTTSRQDSIPHP